MMILTELIGLAFDNHYAIVPLVAAALISGGAQVASTGLNSILGNNQKGQPQGYNNDPSLQQELLSNKARLEYQNNRISELQYAKGGSPQANVINIEKGEIGIDTKGNIVEDYTSNLFSPHSIHGRDPENNIIATKADFIIPKNKAEEYKNTDELGRRTIVRQVQRTSDPTFKSRKGGFTKANMDGNTISGIVGDDSIYQGKPYRVSLNGEGHKKMLKGGSPHPDGTFEFNGYIYYLKSLFFNEKENRWMVRSDNTSGAGGSYIPIANNEYENKLLNDNIKSDGFGFATSANNEVLSFNTPNTNKPSTKYSNFPGVDEGLREFYTAQEQIRADRGDIKQSEVKKNVNKKLGEDKKTNTSPNTQTAVQTTQPNQPSAVQGNDGSSVSGSNFGNPWGASVPPYTAATPANTIGGKPVGKPVKRDNDFQRIPTPQVEDISQAYKNNVLDSGYTDYNKTPDQRIKEAALNPPEGVNPLNASQSTDQSPQQSSINPVDTTGAGGSALGKIAGGLLTYAPSIFNAVAGLQDPVQFDPIQNPYEAQALNVLGSRSIDDSAIQADIDRERALADRNARIGVSSSGAVHSRLRGNYGIAAREGALSKERTAAINQQFKGEYANALNNYGQQRVASEYANRDLNTRLRANRTNFLTAAVSGVSTAYQNEQRNNVLSGIIDQAYPEMYSLKNRGRNGK
jgi:hypothetical protein